LVQPPIIRWFERTIIEAARYRACAAPPSAPTNEASRHLISGAATPSFAKEGTAAPETGWQFIQLTMSPGTHG